MTSTRYKGEHARYVLQMSPVLEDHEMQLISFDKFYYDTKVKFLGGCQQC